VISSDIEVTNPPRKFPFLLSAPAMIFGHDIVENAEILSTIVDNVEIVFFSTPTQNNYLTSQDITTLSDIARHTGISYTVHLPASLEIASSDIEQRVASVQSAIELIKQCEPLNPQHFILHVPYSPPTLVYEPGDYFKKIEYPEWHKWLERASNSLMEITSANGKKCGLLLENINYSVYHLEPLIKYNSCNLCLDVGHLLLGQESVSVEIKSYHRVIREIHLHGVQGHTDHYSIATLSQRGVLKWLKVLNGMGFSGILNLEVFSPSDLRSSLDLIDRLVPC
jgi:sugar phosphate isomerase/epimerase